MNTLDNYIKKWQAELAELDAKAERLDAQERLRYNDWREDISAQFEAAGDWTEASWDEFIAKVKQQWHDMIISWSKDKDEDDDL